MMCVLSRLISSCWLPLNMCVGVFPRDGTEQNWNRPKRRFHCLAYRSMWFYMFVCECECDVNMPASYLLTDTGHLVSSWCWLYGRRSACWMTLGGIIIVKKTLPPINYSKWRNLLYSLGSWCWLLCLGAISSSWDHTKPRITQPSIPRNYIQIGQSCTLWFTTSGSVQC